MAISLARRKFWIFLVVGLTLEVVHGILRLRWPVFSAPIGIRPVGVRLLMISEYFLWYMVNGIAIFKLIDAFRTRNWRIVQLLGMVFGCAVYWALFCWALGEPLN